MLLIIKSAFYHFNTSNVTIQHGRATTETREKFYFNTSNVTIQLSSILFLRYWMLYFNTSNVTIQPNGASRKNLYFSISIHLMLLFNLTKHLFRYTLIHFNTSNVTIQPFEGIELEDGYVFQYI